MTKKLTIWEKEQRRNKRIALNYIKNLLKNKNEQIHVHVDNVINYAFEYTYPTYSEIKITIIFRRKIKK